MKRKLAMLTCLAGLLGAAGSASAVQINFTGGNVVLNDSTIVTTNNNVSWSNVDYYTEGGFKLDFIGGESNSFSANIGNYYGVGDDVIHGHWATGNYGGLQQVVVTKLDGAAFDLNYFVLTSNTDFGGGAASGNEKTRIYASTDGINPSYSQLLPPENWGFPATHIFLDANFDNIKAFWFSPDNQVDCFGMDNFFINEPPPGKVPEPGSLSLIVASLAGLLLRRRARA